MKHLFTVAMVVLGMACLHPLLGWVILGIEASTERMLAGGGLGLFILYLAAGWEFVNYDRH